jgi:ABC-type amino acid transport substrate-binding protein
MFSRLGPLLVALACWTVGQALAGEPMQWIAGALPPFAWQEGAENHGLACDLVKAMAHKLGRSGDIDFYPWARAVKMASDKPNYGIFPLARTPDREAGFVWLIPLIKVDYVFLENKGSPGGHLAEGDTRIAELRSKRVAVLRGSPIVNNLRAQNFQHVLEGKDYPELLRMLSSGLVEAVYAGRPMVLASVVPSGYNEQDFRVSAALGDATLYMATSKGLAEPEAALWRSAYDSLVKDGTVQQLRKKYGL